MRRLLYALFALACAPALAQPTIISVAGQIDHGQTGVVITGTGFTSGMVGYAWDDLELCTAGSGATCSGQNVSTSKLGKNWNPTPTSGGWNVDSESAPLPMYNTARAYGPGVASSFIDMSTAPGESSVHIASVAGGFTQIYATYMIYYERFAYDGTDFCNPQYKGFRVQTSTGNIYTGNDQLAHQHLAIPDKGGPRLSLDIDGTPRGICSPFGADGSLSISSTLDQDRWVRMEHYYTIGHTPDAVMRVWKDGTSLRNSTGGGNCGAFGNDDCTGTCPTFNRFHFPFFIGGSCSTQHPQGFHRAHLGKQWLDNLYISLNSGEARVEICSGSTWAAKGTCEIQPVSASPSTSSATIEINRGGFAVDQAPKYMYVVNSTGTGNTNGFLVTFGQAGSGDPVCSDGFDNDGDGVTDYNAGAGDPGCSSDADTSELDETTCNDGIDNDNDGTFDFRSAGSQTGNCSAPVLGDDGCASASDADEKDNTSPAQCDDNVDNDGDELYADYSCDWPTDFSDPGCSSPSDTSELNVITVECDNGVDDDPGAADGTDWPTDPHCDNPTDPSESASSSGNNEVGTDTFTDHSNWSNLLGSTWTAGSGTFSMDAAPGGDAASFFFTANTLGTDHYACTDIASAPAGEDIFGLLLRDPGVDMQGGFPTSLWQLQWYEIDTLQKFWWGVRRRTDWTLGSMAQDGAEGLWGCANTGGTGNCATIAAAVEPTNGEILCASVEGGGLSTVLRVWIDPAGTGIQGPDFWGAADWTHTLTQDTACFDHDLDGLKDCPDTGQFVGLYCHANGCIEFDDFRGGTVSPPGCVNDCGDNVICDATLGGTEICDVGTGGAGTADDVVATDCVAEGFDCGEVRCTAGCGSIDTITNGTCTNIVAANGTIECFNLGNTGEICEDNNTPGIGASNDDDVFNPSAVCGDFTDGVGVPFTGGDLTCDCDSASNISAAACIGSGNPEACCTGAGTGPTCLDSSDDCRPTGGATINTEDCTGTAATPNNLIRRSVGISNSAGKLE